MGRGEQRRGAASSSSCSRRLCLGGLLSLAAVSLGCRKEEEKPAVRGPQGRRIVSLSPGTTESLLRLDAADELVGISDYCHLPQGLSVPKVGTALTPNYEAIARVRPTLILATEVAGSQLRPLGKLAKTVSLPWLELDQVLASVRRLGQLIGREAAAQELADRMKNRLSVETDARAPRVLWVLDLDDGSSNDTWFIRNNSLHGAVLRAAGAQNAVARDILGPPKLSAEQLLAVDPEAILMVVSDPSISATEITKKQLAFYNHFAKWTPLFAVKNNRILVVHHPDAMNLGPGVLELSDTIEEALDRFSTPPAPSPEHSVR